MDTTLGGRRCRSFRPFDASAAAESDRDAAPARASLVAWVDRIVYPTAVQLCCVAMAAVNDLDLPGLDSAGQSGLTGQVAMKLAVAALGLAAGLWGFWFRPDLRRLLTSVPGMLLAALVLWHVAGAAFALSPAKAVFATLTFVSVAGVTLATLTEWGFRRLLHLVLAGTALYCLACLAVYAAAPELAMFREVLNSMVSVDRFGGLSHPNVTGKYAALLGLLAAAAAVRGDLRLRWLLPAVALSLGILIATKSRTPAIAGLVAAAVMALPLLRYHASYLIAAAAALAAVGGYLIVEASVGSDAIFEKVLRTGTKTGSLEELTTFTGRTEIWAYSLERSAERPLLGWGVGSTEEVMKEHSGHSHNILLHPLLALGVPGALLVASLLALGVAQAIGRREPIIRGAVVFTLVLGVAESPLLRTFPDSLTMLWIAVAFLPIAERIERSNNASG